MERCDFSFIPGHGIFYSPFFPQLAAIPSRWLDLNHLKLINNNSMSYQ
jgi:hypothetical protein